MRISDWSSDVCSSDLNLLLLPVLPGARERLAAFDAGADVRRRTAGTGAIPWLLPVGWTSAAQARREIVGLRDAALALGGDAALADLTTGPWTVPRLLPAEIGRASSRERGRETVWISVVAVSLKKKTIQQRSR